MMNEESLKNGNQAKSTVKQLRLSTGLSQAKFGNAYGIPLRTIQSWECSEDSPNFRSCPPYVVSLLERAVKEDFHSSN